MNKVVDERLVPDGEYVDALNIRMGSTENSEIGVIENAKGNIQLCTLKYIDGTPLSSQAKCIGAIEDSATETLYWFVHDKGFEASTTGKLDMIVSYNVLTSILTYHVISTDDGSGVNTTLNFNEKYLITGVNIVDKLVFFTEDYNPPRVFNRTRSYAAPISYIDQFSAEALLVIKKPPMEAPKISTLSTGQQEEFLSDRFICFAYRYRYADNEYSATSQWSAPAFLPNPFEFSINSFLNEGMVNLADTAIVKYNSGGPLVVGIDLLFKEAGNNAIKVIEKINKADLGLADNTQYEYTFTNSKVFTVLPEYELLRLYDNVPLLAKAQTIMGNRLMYGNYVEGYNLIDKDKNPVKLEYNASLVSELIDSTDLPDSTASARYNFGVPQTIPNAAVFMDLSNVQLKEGASITLELRLSHALFAGDTPFPAEESQNLNLVFSYLLTKDYSSVYALASSTEFLSAVGTLSNIKTVADSCSGNTLTDRFNCIVPTNLDALVKFQSGIGSANQPVLVIASPASNSIGLQFPAMRFVDDIVTPTQNVYEYYSVVFSEAFYQKVNSPRSLHSNRGYEVGIVYMDDFGRSSTALVSPNNTVHIPCSASDTKNSIRVTIPSTQKAPFWAKRYKFVLKPDEENYETIYSSIFFTDPLSNAAYFLLEGENARKIEQGDRLIVKADTSGPTNTCVYATVLEKESKLAGFIEIPSTLDPNVNIPVPSGVYMKINPNNFAVVQDELSVIAPGVIQIDEDNAGEYPILNYPMNRLDETTGQYVDYSVPAGSRIKLSFRFQRLGPGAGNGGCERRIYTLEKTFVSSSNYDNMKDWWDGDNVSVVLNDGTQEVGGNQCDVNNEYVPTLAASNTDIPTELCTNYYRFYRNSTNNQLTLIVSGTVRCGGALSKEKRRSTVIVNIEVFRSENTLVFETEPSDALPDVFFENHLSFGIDANGNHLGNIQNQNIATNTPAIVDTEFFNCFAFGNGVESYKIRDSIVGKTFNLGNRVTSVSAQDYKQVDRFADITYSGVYNDESNVNRFNEFNLGLLNYKPLEDSFGPIYILDGRETDVLVLQEDKISYVLAGKNLLSDSTGGGAIASVPEVLGTQIARNEKYGISFHPESYVQWGAYRYFTDVKRGAVIQLVGNSAAGDQIKVISEAGMRTWFRDNFIESFDKQKLGGFDPYMNEYVLASNSEALPQPQQCIACSQGRTLNIGAGSSVEFCVDLGVAIGNSPVSFAVSEGSVGSFKVETLYNGVAQSSGIVTDSGQFIVNKNSNTENVVVVKVTAIDSIVVTVSVGCPTAEQITLMSVCLTSGIDAGKFIHNEYRYIFNENYSPLQSSLIEFATGSANPLVSSYTSTSGAPGTGGFPPAGAIMEMASNKINFDTFDFDIDTDKMLYLRTNTLYPNTQAGINALLAAATEATVAGAGGYYQGSFEVPESGQYLYMIWDYRNSLPVQLCYSPSVSKDACCGCGDVPDPVTLRFSTVSMLDACCGHSQPSYPELLCYSADTGIDACCGCAPTPPPPQYSISVLQGAAVTYESNNIDDVIAHLNTFPIVSDVTVRFNDNTVHQPTGGQWIVTYENTSFMFKVLAAPGASPTIDGQLLNATVISIGSSNVIWDGVNVINAFTADTDTGGTIIRLQGYQSYVTIKNCLLRRGFVGIRGTTDISNLNIENVTIEEVNYGSIRIGGGAFSNPDMYEDFDLRTSADYDMHNVSIKNVTVLDTLAGGNVPGTTQPFSPLILTKMTENISIDMVKASGTGSCVVNETSTNLSINGLFADEISGGFGMSIQGTDFVTISNNFLKPKAGPDVTMIYMNVARNISFIHNSFIGINQFDNLNMSNLRRILKVVGNLVSLDYEGPLYFGIAASVNGVAYTATMANDFQEEHDNVLWNNNQYIDMLTVTRILSGSDLKVRKSNTFGGAILDTTYVSTYAGYGVNTSFIDTGFVTLSTRINPDSSVSEACYLPDVYPTSDGRNMILSSVSSIAEFDAGGYYRVYPTDAGAFDRDATSLTPPAL